jgi:hypothetical protein
LALLLSVYGGKRKPRILSSLRVKQAHVRRALRREENEVTVPAGRVNRGAVVREHLEPELCGMDDQYKERAQVSR